ncbi:metal ABC transporter substrate-binding protein [Cohnella rhizoplanae]|uniref:metal ABC transporter substrate-binding protein n=1 Tax=Cohnella rhizoplanae TaxID=2974897 RepID=UPI0022FFC2F2|nr:metal ABC transporter substrate-binding protein [Cohnella sp. JJ-181]CAI6019326.1 High-affinity zinc uptake system binding-protein ZnuA [Cohnella sp. JJ-181]
MKSYLGRTSLAVAAAMLLLAGCGSKDGAGSGSDDGAERRLKVVASFYPMYEFSRQVAGDRADVVLMVPDGVEPHDWEPTPKDMAMLSEADVFVYNGIVEGWAEQALASAKNAKRVDVEAAAGLELRPGSAEDEADAESSGGHDHESADPHVWLSPALAQREVERIRDGLAQADPAHRTDYDANAKAYVSKLQKLDADFRDALGAPKRKAFVTQHAAFGYLAREYGLTQVPISGLSPDQEPTPAQMAAVVEEIASLGISTIFFEELVDPKIAETIAGETGAKTEVLNPIEGLTKQDKAQDLDYIGIMEKNLAALEKALNE